MLSHLLENSWWPLLISVSSGLMMISILEMFTWGISLNLFFFLFIWLCVFYTWLRDMNRESDLLGTHTRLVISGLKWGLVWFLFSEVWFFFGIFWSFFHSSFSPLSGGMWSWPYIGIDTIPPFQVPLLNTLILLFSGATATLSHQEILSSKPSVWLLISSFLGFYFLMLQVFEYSVASFSFSSGVYGSLFFMGTGFHGFHVCLGMLMLMISSLRMLQNKITANHHFGLEFSLWYWHFVDVVWLFFVHLSLYVKKMIL
uniref:Cytochrome c oxidase subunit 3 n=1 Tax=Xiphinema pachtaicum TaxID=260251 RepID=A0A1P8C783_9BILA|nr:cytochrome c oxidase subunit III [Xiphinema pachtaicum]AOT84267.1 cytochrome c oxidase subunit III [Xiphinema pachtaicum]